MRIGFCYNVLHEGKQGTSNEQDFDAPKTIAQIAKTIEGLGHAVVEIEAREDIYERLRDVKSQIDLVFNIAEGLYGDARESWVPMACEQLQIPYTHSSPTVHALKLDKALSKLTVAGMGIKVPGEKNFPKIIKPNAEGSSVGVFNGNVVENQAELEAQIKVLRDKGLEGELLAEEYIDGREFTVGVVGNGKTAEVLPIIEQNFDFLPKGMRPIAGYELKWEIEDQLADLKIAYSCPAKLDKKLEKEIQETTLKIYRTMGVRDCARIDYRMNRKNELYFIEINTLPGLNPNLDVISYLPIAARTRGWDFKELVRRIIEGARERYQLK